MKRLLCLPVVLLLLCGCSGDGEQQAANTQPPTSPDVSAPADDADSGVAERTADTAEPPATSEVSESDSDSGETVTREPEEDNNRRRQPGPPKRSDRTKGDDSGNRSTGNSDSPGSRGNNRRNPSPSTGPGAPGDTAAEVKLMPAFPSSLGEVGLSNGDLVPEIVGTDTEGVDFKLSDYQGKVIMLDFWGHW